jgi:hypothetical protein
VTRVSLAPWVNPLSVRDLADIIWATHIRRMNNSGARMPWHCHIWGEVVMADTRRLPFGLELRTYWQICDVGYDEETGWNTDLECAAMRPGMRIERAARPLFEDVPTACPARSPRKKPWRLFNLR